MYISVYTYIYIYIHIPTHTCTHMHTRTHSHVHIFYICIYMYIYTQIYLYIYQFTYTYLCHFHVIYVVAGCFRRNHQCNNESDTRINMWRFTYRKNTHVLHATPMWFILVQTTLFDIFSCRQYCRRQSQWNMIIIAKGVYT